jgi:glycosyltransferase involved in cell wall biosynthesis
MKKLRVLMLGPSLKEKGGMGSVATLILKATPPEIEIKHFSTWDGEASQVSKLNMLLVFIRAISVLTWELLNDRVDVVHLHVAERGSVWRKSILAAIAMIFRKPVFMHTHGCEFHLFFEKLSPILKSAVCWIFQRCTYVIVLSDSWKDFYLKHCRLKEDKVIVMPNPIEFPVEIPERLESEDFNFVFLGKIDRRKGVFDLLNAFAQLDEKLKRKASITIAGTGDLKGALELAEYLKIDKRVHFKGWIDSTQRDRLLARANAFLLPSYNEGLPMALLEAMSWGLPAIATPVGGIGEIIIDRQSGLLVEPGNVKQIAKAMQSLLEEESLRMRLGNTARTRVAGLDLKYYSVSLGNLYWSTVTRQAELQKLPVS